MDFEQWFNSLELDNWTNKKYMHDAFKAGQQSKQADIEELQKRIDDALDHAVNHGGYDDLTHIINILKGK